MKKKKSYSKHDLRRELKNTRIVVSNLEKVFQLYVEMKKDEKKFEKFLDAKPKKEKDI